MENQNQIENEKVEEIPVVEIKPKGKKYYKEYNNNYYVKNKDIITAKLRAKEECEHCKKLVSHQQMVKHKTSNYCQKAQKAKEDNTLVTRLLDIIKTHNIKV